MRSAILRAQFTDRAGRTVYSVTPIEMVQDPDEPDKAQMQEGAAIGLLRMKPGSNAEPGPEVEWFEMGGPQGLSQEPGPPRAELPPIFPTLEPDGPGPHQGGTG